MPELVQQRVQRHGVGGQVVHHVHGHVLLQQFLEHVTAQEAEPAGDQDLGTGRETCPGAAVETAHAGGSSWASRAGTPRTSLTATSAKAWRGLLAMPSSADSSRSVEYHPVNARLGWPA